MQRPALFAASLLLALGLSFTSANADHAVNLLWTSSATGASGLGTNSVTASLGDTLTLSVNVTIDSAELAGFGTSYVWNPGSLTHLLSVINPANPYQVTGNGAVSNANGTATGQLAGSLLFGSIGAGTILQGEMTFVASAVGSTDIVTGVFTGADGVANGAQQPYTANTVFNQASINIVPEPGTAALLALGLGGLTIAGRRRR